MTSPVGSHSSVTSTDEDNFYVFWFDDARSNSRADWPELRNYRLKVEIFQLAATIAPLKTRLPKRGARKKCRLSQPHASVRWLFMGFGRAKKSLRFWCERTFSVVQTSSSSLCTLFTLESRRSEFFHRTRPTQQRDKRKVKTQAYVSVNDENDRSLPHRKCACWRERARREDHLLLLKLIATVNTLPVAVRFNAAGFFYLYWTVWHRWKICISKILCFCLFFTHFLLFIRGPGRERRLSKNSRDEKHLNSWVSLPWDEKHLTSWLSSTWDEKHLKSGLSSAWDEKHLNSWVSSAWDEKHLNNKRNE